MLRCLAHWQLPDRLNPAPNEVALELGETGHDDAHELAASAEVKAEPGLSQDADFPAVQIIERLNEVLSARTVQLEFG